MIRWLRPNLDFDDIKAIVFLVIAAVGVVIFSWGVIWPLFRGTA